MMVTRQEINECNLEINLNQISFVLFNTNVLFILVFEFLQLTKQKIS